MILFFAKGNNMNKFKKDILNSLAVRYHKYDNYRRKAVFDHNINLVMHYELLMKEVRSIMTEIEEKKR